MDGFCDNFLSIASFKEDSIYLFVGGNCFLVYCHGLLWPVYLGKRHLGGCRLKLYKVLQIWA